MAMIYVREQGAIIRKHSARILVEKNHDLLQEILLRETSGVAIFGNVQVTTQVLSELLERGIPLALYTRNGRLKGHLAPELSKNLPLRLAQYKAAMDEGEALMIARAIVRAKLLNSAALIDGYRAHYPSEEWAAASRGLREAAANAATAETHSRLLGFEGAAAASYFRVFAGMNRSAMPFDGREKHPPPDPINALLSLSYTLLMNELRGITEGMGLEPHLGFLHRVDYGRPSLALDLLEPFRPALADRLTLRLVNEGILKAGDFASRVDGPLSGSVILAPDSLRRYLAEYEAAMSETRKAAPQGMRAVLRAEVAKLGAALGKGQPFAPYLEEEGGQAPCCT